MRSPPKAGRGGAKGCMPMPAVREYAGGGGESSAKLNFGLSPADGRPSGMRGSGAGARTSGAGWRGSGMTGRDSAAVRASARSRAAVTRCAASRSAASLCARSLSARADCCGACAAGGGADARLGAGAAACGARGAAGAAREAWRGAIGAGRETGCGAAAGPFRLGGTRSGLNSSDSLGISFAPMPRRSRQLRFSFAEPLEGSWSIFYRFTSHLFGGPHAEDSKAIA